jgi:hypothetical protein
MYYIVLHIPLRVWIVLLEFVRYNKLSNTDIIFLIGF